MMPDLLAAIGGGPEWLLIALFVVVACLYAVRVWRHLKR